MTAQACQSKKQVGVITGRKTLEINSDHTVLVPEMQDELMDVRTTGTP